MRLSKRGVPPILLFCGGVFTKEIFYETVWMWHSLITEATSFRETPFSLQPIYRKMFNKRISTALHIAVVSFSPKRTNMRLQRPQWSPSWSPPIPTRFPPVIWTSRCAGARCRCVRGRPPSPAIKLLAAKESQLEEEGGTANSERAIWLIRRRRLTKITLGKELGKECKTSSWVNWSCVHCYWWTVTVGTMML